VVVKTSVGLKRAKAKLKGSLAIKGIIEGRIGIATIHFPAKAEQEIKTLHYPNKKK
jgi:hypothetical protein